MTSRFINDVTAIRGKGVKDFVTTLELKGLMMGGGGSKLSIIACRHL